jgi:hypothetical protein
MKTEGVKMFDVIDLKVGVLATMNVAGVGVQNFLSNAEPVMHFLVAAGQIGVAVVTIIFVIAKLRRLRKKDK